MFYRGAFHRLQGLREPLHGHTYQAEVKVSGPVGPDGYVVDFLVLKKIAQEECQQLHFTTLLPEHSDCLRISADTETVRVECEDGTRFSFPRQDVRLLPIVHSSSEEIAQYLIARLRARLAEARGE